MELVVVVVVVVAWSDPQRRHWPWYTWTVPDTPAEAAVGSYSCHHYLEMGMLSVVRMICRMAVAAAGLDAGTVAEYKDEKVASS